MKRLLALSLTAFAGCSTFDTPGTTRPLHLIAPAPPTQAAPVAPSLRVRAFAVESGFAGFDLVWRRDGAWQQDAYHGWLARPADMLADASVAWLGGSGCFSRVQRDGLTLTTDRTLEASVTRLAADLDAKPPCASIAITFYLTGRDVEPLVVHAEACAPMRSTDAASAVQAWDAALAECLGKFAEAVKSRGPTAPNTAPSTSPAR